MQNERRKNRKLRKGRLDGPTARYGEKTVPRFDRVCFAKFTVLAKGFHRRGKKAEGRRVTLQVTRNLTHRRH